MHEICHLWVYMDTSRDFCDKIHSYIYIYIYIHIYTYIYIYATRCIHICDMISPNVTRLTCICDQFSHTYKIPSYTRFIHICDIIHDKIICDKIHSHTRFAHKSDMTHSNVPLVICFFLVSSHSSVAYIDATHLYVWHDSYICVTWIIHTSQIPRKMIQPRNLPNRETPIPRYKFK